MRYPKSVIRRQNALVGGGLAGAGFAHADDVGVGDRDVVAQHPADRVGVERGPGQHVDPHLRAGRRQARAGDERPEHRRLVGGHPVRARPAPTPATQPRPGRAGAAAGDVPEQPGSRWARLRRRGGGQVVPEVSQQTEARPGRATPARVMPGPCDSGPCCRSGFVGAQGQASPRRVRLTPSGTTDAANATSWREVQPQRRRTRRGGSRRPGVARTRRSGPSWAR